VGALQAARSDRARPLLWAIVAVLNHAAGGGEGREDPGVRAATGASRKRGISSAIEVSQWIPSETPQRSVHSAARLALQRCRVFWENFLTENEIIVKSFITSSIGAVALIALATGGAVAGDQLVRATDGHGGTRVFFAPGKIDMTTVAFYSGRHGITQESRTQDRGTERRLVRMNRGEGKTTYMFRAD
jgi:hypothetical protein